MADVLTELAVMLLLAVYYAIPAYVANGLAVITGGGKPIDLGRKFRDGRRIFGDGKTIRGFIGGVACGFIAGLIQLLIAPYFNEFIQPLITLYSLNPVISGQYQLIIYTPPLRAFLLALGGLTGDLVGSFIKRRLNLERGRPAPFIDQLDFICFALLFAYFITPISLEYIIILIVLTPVIHLLANIAAYYLKLKSVPW
ncbi:MAG: CDP-2,3-bis-(O-geranylgeranyl)-sn-glycerol synthase [Candidatus Odinarchaeum yellowstonii]|uniref:CDP-archaeol synthase n=1 Tax=Odinarchaeota yellowstonii (strain LCB_4) TaxID=1841599 RepID=A0AAF0D3K8_ODILC|nr:MAG: CDP-2,3-bis-(O-geranylgeranyl)-sn-glycerol synthase [Candidatus Odinarchaeum yellowstonii]